MGQLREIEPQLNDMGFQLMAIAPDLAAGIHQTMEKHHLRGHVLSDSRMAAARAFRVAYEVDENTLKQLKDFGVDLEAASAEKHHQLPVPAVFVVGTNDVIQFTYANPDYKVRLDPELLVAAVRAARK